MTRYNIRKTVLVVIILTLVYAGAAQDKGATSTTVPGKAKVADNTEPPSAPRDGIKVHGHWTIVVRDPDGSVASRNEFENSLASCTNCGNAVISKILSRQSSVGTWEVDLYNLVNPNQAVCASSPVGGTCAITEPSVTHLLNGLVPFPNLTVQFPTYGIYVNAGVVLTGTAKAVNTGAIASVNTSLNTCPNSVSPATCTTPTAQGAMTQHDLSPPISVQAGQSIDVTVVLSFT